MLSLGTYPQVSLAEARKRRDEARNVLQSGRDPSSERKADKLRVKLSVENTFGAIAMEWLEQQRGKLANITFHKSGMAAFSFVTAGARRTAHRRHHGAGDSRHPARHRSTRFGTRPRTGSSSASAKCFATPSPPVAPSATRAATCAEHSPPWSSTISRAAVTDPNDVADLLRAIDQYQALAGDEDGPGDSRHSCSRDPATCVRWSGPNSISTQPNPSSRGTR